MSQIQKIETIPFELEMNGVLRWGQYSELSSLKHVLIKITCSDGNYGIAEAPVRPTIYGETVESIEAIVHMLGQCLINTDIEDVESITNILNTTKNNHCSKGAIDIAWHDLRAKSQGKSLYEMYAQDKKIRVSYILGISDPDAMLVEAKRVFNSGVSVFKIKIGRNAEHDQKIVNLLQNEFGGTDVILYADANETLTPKNAPGRLERLARLGIAYVEEPLPTYLLKERSKLKAMNILPIIADDSCFTPTDLLRELDFDTFDILNIKTARTGFTDSFAMLDLAKKAQKGVMLGSQASAGLGTLHGAIFASHKNIDYPSELSFPLRLQCDILEKPLVYHEGYLDVNDLKKHFENGNLLKNNIGCK